MNWLIDWFGLSIVSRISDGSLPVFVPRLFEENKAYRNGLRPSVTLSDRSITQPFIKDFWNNLTQMFIITGPWTISYLQGQSHTWSSIVKIVWWGIFHALFITFSAINGFWNNLRQLLLYRGRVMPISKIPRSRSNLEVKAERGLL